MDGSTPQATNTADDGVFVARARYYSPANIFKVERPDVPQHIFADELNTAMAAATPTGWISLDISTTIGLQEPATTPLMLARYARIAAGETLSGQFRASGEFYYVIQGSGRAAKAGETLAWQTGDVFSLPGGGETLLTAGADDAVLFLVTNEPELAFHGFEAPTQGGAKTQAVRYPLADIRAQMDKVRDIQKADPNVSGLALHLTSEHDGNTDAVHPTIKLAMNSLDAGSVQRPHRHNSVALTLPIHSEGVYSVIEGNRLDWQQYALMITPPAELHEHHNEGEEMMLSLVIQDGGLYFRCRTIGFSFD
jgi:gentisate 1,2-dioxygenase